MLYLIIEKGVLTEPLLPPVEHISTGHQGRKRGHNKDPLETIPGVLREHQDTSTQPVQEAGASGLDPSFVMLSSGAGNHMGSVRRKSECIQPTGESKQVSFSHGTLGHLPYWVIGQIACCNSFRFRKK